MIAEYTHVFPSGASMVIIGWQKPNGGLLVTDLHYDPAPRLERDLKLTRPAVYIHIEPRLVA